VQHRDKPHEDFRFDGFDFDLRAELDGHSSNDRSRQGVAIDRQKYFV